MKNRINSYDFSVPSSSKKPGFELFRNKKDNRYYFHFNDEDGQPFLFSQGYRNRNSRDKAIRSVIRNAVNTKRYVITKTAEGKAFFQLKAGNHQEIARSRGFENNQELSARLNLLKRSCLDASKSTTEKTFWRNRKTKEDPGTVVPVTQQEEDSSNRLRYRFTLIFYPGSKIWVLKNDFTGRSCTFKDLEKADLSNYLKKEIAPRISAATEAFSSKVTAMPGIHIIPQAEEISDIIIQTKDGKVHDKLLSNRELLKVVVGLPNEKIPLDDTPLFDVELKLKSLNNITQLPLGKVSKMPISNDGTISIPLTPGKHKATPPGIYRLITTIRTEGKKSKSSILQGSRLVIVE